MPDPATPRPPRRRHDTLAIVVTWNKAAMLDAMLESLRASGPVEFDVIVVDNASTDGTVAMLAERHPWVEVVRNPENLGGTGGFNRGMLEGLARGYKYLWLMDNDIIVHEGAHRALRAAMNADGRVAIVGAHVLYMEEPTRTQEIGGRINWRTGELVQLNKDAVDPPRCTNDVDYVSACCLLVRAAAVREAGIWDPGFFITFDDVEWCARMKRHGWRIVATSECRVRHASFFARRPRQGLVSCYYSVRNGLYFHRRCNTAGRRFRLMYALVRRLLGDAWLFRRGVQQGISRALTIAMRDYLEDRMGKCPEDIAFDEGESRSEFPRVPRGARVLLIASVSPAWIEAQRDILEREFPGAEIDVFVPSHARELIHRPIRGAVIVPFETFPQRMAWLLRSLGTYHAVVASTNIPRFLFEDVAAFSIRLAEDGTAASVERGGFAAVARKVALRAVTSLVALPIAVAAAIKPLPRQGVFPFRDPGFIRSRTRPGVRRRRGLVGIAKGAVNLGIALLATAIVTPMLAVAFQLSRLLQGARR